VSGKFTNLWYIWESIKVLLSSAEFNGCGKITWSTLSPSFTSNSSGVSLVGGHSITPVLGGTDIADPSFAVGEITSFR